MRINIGQFLAKRALLEPQKVGLIAGEQRLTFREMNTRANKAAQALAARGVRRGDRVAVLLRNSVPYYDLYFGLAKLGAILCGVNWRLAAPEIGYILKNSGARHLIFHDEFWETVQEAIQNAPMEACIAVGQAPDASCLAYDDFVDSGADTEPAAETVEDDALLLMYTSGTTGHPKGAVLTHRQMFWSSTTIIYSLDHRHTDTNLLPLPMYHIGGMSFVTAYVHLGATVVVIPAWEPAKVLQLIAREKINHFMAVPTMLQSLLDHPLIDEVDLSSLRWLLVAAAPVPGALIRAFAARDILVQQSYGLTETAGPAAFLGPHKAIEKAGSTGLPFFHTDVRVVDLNGQDVPAGEVGEVWIRGPHLITSYWQNEAATAAAFEGEWFRSGDVAYRDQDGYLYIVDRMKDMIISGGENIYPAEVENVLYSHPDIAEVAVVGVADEKWGETVCAVIVPRNNATLTLEAIRDFCEGRIARYKMPRRLVVNDRPLPRNPTGKLMKTVLRRQLREHGSIQKEQL